MADSLRGRAWERLARPPKYEVRTEERHRPKNVKEAKVIEREFKNIRLRSEEVAEFLYSPTFCQKTYRMVVVRKNLSVENPGMLTLMLENMGGKPITSIEVQFTGYYRYPASLNITGKTGSDMLELAKKVDVIERAFSMR